jgi:hypothetical protein
MIHNHNPDIRDLVCVFLYLVVSFVCEAFTSVGPTMFTTDDTSTFSEYAVWLENNVWSLFCGVQSLNGSIRFSGMWALITKIAIS